MLTLPVGVYAVAPAFQEGQVSFTFKGESYQAIVGENAFPSLEQLAKQTLLCAEEAFLGYSGTPVVLMPSGVCPIGQEGSCNDVRFYTYFSQTLTILGENAGISPNGADLRSAGNRQEESVIQGSVYFGTIALKDSVDGCLTLDGLTVGCKVMDNRTGGKNASVVLKNCIFTAGVGRHAITVGPDFEGERSLTVSDCRAVAMDSQGGGGNLLGVSCGAVTVERLYVADTEKCLAFSDYSRTVYNHFSKVLFRDCLVENCNSARGLTFLIPEGTQADLVVENCTFSRFSAENDPALTAILPTGSKLTVSGCHFVGNWDVPAIEIDGDTSGVTVTDCTQEGFSTLWAPKPPRRTAVDESIVYPVTDAHTPVENPDFAALDAIYEGKQLFFGDFHCHSNSGGTSDGKTPLAEYVPSMKKLGMDFAAIMDHRQMRHYFLPEWDEDYLICASEPGVTLDAPERPAPARGMHYAMSFPDKTGLAQVMGAFPEFGYTGTWDGHFGYPRLTVARMRELAEYIYSIGGLLSNAHPKQQMFSNDPMHYYFGDHVPIETVHGDVSGLATKQNRELWVELLNRGCRVKTYGSSDAHGPVSNRGLTATYAPRHYSTDMFNAVRSGNCTAGGVGIQMSIDDTPMGSVAEFAPGKTLYLKVDRFHRDHLTPDTVYSLKVFTDQGLAYAKEFDGSPVSVALPVEKRAYYRAEIINESDHCIVALSNPIWLD